MQEKIKKFENLEKKIEEIPKQKPKKININEILEKMNKDKNQHNRGLSFGVEGFYSNNIIKEKLAKLNSTIKEEKKEKFIPKKIDMKKHSELMKLSLKTSNNSKEVNEIKKFNIEEFMNKMKEEETIKTHNEEFFFFF